MGVYHYDFDKKRVDDIEKGQFVFKRKGGNGYIFKNEDGSWSVSV